MKLAVFEELQANKAYLAVVGIGYVGLPIAVAFAGKVRTIGFDINQEKINTYQQGIDPTQEIGDEKLRNTSLEFTADPARLRDAKFIIVAVPTPINGDKTPDLTPVISASTLVGKNLAKGSIVVFESTVYPGVTEEICLPILERESGLICGTDFKIGYSPERINPGDKVHRLENIRKIVAGMDEETLDTMASVYELVIQAGVYKAPSIKVAEAAKLAENAQRDLNIAFMNELSMAFHQMGISTKEVVDAMNTKWNALKFYPGLVGGHCIGVDPYYFIYRAEMQGYDSRIISASRRINDYMGTYVADNVIKIMIQADLHVKKANIYLLGVTFKENCPDIRNSKSIDVYRRLQEYGVQVKVIDPVADPVECKRELDIDFTDIKNVRDADCLVFLVAHQQFAKLSPANLTRMFRQDKQTTNVLVDIKSIFDRRNMEERGYAYWSL